MHGNVKVCCVASDEALVLLLSGTATYPPDLSAADHLISPCWLGMVQMVRAVVEAGDVSQLRFIQRPHDVGVPHLELRPPGFTTPSFLELLRGTDAMLAVNYYELPSLDSIPRGWRLSQEPIVETRNTQHYKSREYTIKKENQKMQSTDYGGTRATGQRHSKRL